MSGLAGYPVKRRFIEATLEHAKRDGGIQGFGNSGGDFYFSVDIHPVTDEEIEQFLNVLDAVNEIRVYDQTIDRIIKEEAAAYFSGQKPVEAVADIIENRVGIYVREIK